MESLDKSSVLPDSKPQALQAVCQKDNLPSWKAGDGFGPTYRQIKTPIGYFVKQVEIAHL